MENHISIEIFSRHHGVETSFVSSLGEYGLIEIIEISHQSYIASEQLSEAEKMIRLYIDLNLNTEGIDVIMNLLARIKEMQHEIIGLQNRLGLYE